MEIAQSSSQLATAEALFYFLPDPNIHQFIMSDPLSYIHNYTKHRIEWLFEIIPVM